LHGEREAKIENDQPPQLQNRRYFDKSILRREVINWELFEVLGEDHIIQIDFFLKKIDVRGEDPPPESFHGPISPVG